MPGMTLGILTNLASRRTIFPDGIDDLGSSFLRPAADYWMIGRSNARNVRPFLSLLLRTCREFFKKKRLSSPRDVTRTPGMTRVRVRTEMGKRYLAAPNEGPRELLAAEGVPVLAGTEGAPIHRPGARQTMAAAMVREVLAPSGTSDVGGDPPHRSSRWPLS